MEDNERRVFAAMRLHPATHRYLLSMGEPNLGRAVDAVILKIIRNLPDPSVYMSGTRRKAAAPAEATSEPPQPESRAEPH